MIRKKDLGGTSAILGSPLPNSSSLKPAFFSLFFFSYLFYLFIYVGSSRTRARTRVPCISRWILKHCATREAQACFLLQKSAFFSCSSRTIFFLYYSLSIEN